MKVRNKYHDVYSGFEFLKNNMEYLNGTTVLICDPNNPIGNKYDDKMLFDLIKRLNQNNVTVLIDCPYRKLFTSDNDTFFEKLLKFENVIILESFSKSVGLSGQRLGFVHSQNQEFKEEFRIRLLYTTNGVNAFGQILVRDLLITEDGQKAVSDFRKKTTTDIKKNIDYLIENKLLASTFYQDSDPIGIFVIVNKTEEELLENKIGSVGLDFFTRDKENGKQFARICVSAPHEKFINFFSKLV